MPHPSRPLIALALALVAVAGAGATLGTGGTGPLAALGGVDLTAAGETAAGETAGRSPGAVSRSAERPVPADGLTAAGELVLGEPGEQEARAQEVRVESDVRAAEDEAQRQAEEAARAAAAEAVTARLAQEAAVAQALADPRAVGRRLAAERGWGEEQFGCLDRLWTRESGWTWSADNPTSSAYGIPQSLPGEKMASAGPDWETNPVTQITWGLGYIGEVYGTPCGAWAKSQRVGWY